MMSYLDHISCARHIPPASDPLNMMHASSSRVGRSVSVNRLWSTFWIKTIGTGVGRVMGVLMLAGACTLSWGQQGAPSVTLATLDWPPYTGKNLPDGGQSTQLVKAAFDAVGYHLQPGFYPWARAVSATTYREGYVGYYPEYASVRTRRECLLAGPIGISRLGFAQKKVRSLALNSVRDLSKYRIGVVRDYVNSEQLDAAIAAGEQPTDEARDDAQNLRKLVAGRIDLAVVDAAVMAYLMSEDPNLRPHSDELIFSERLVETKDLYICFRNDPAGRAARNLFNTGFRKIAAVRLRR